MLLIKCFLIIAILVSRFIHVDVCCLGFTVIILAYVLGFIHLVFPKAVIIHTMRDPMDTLYSCFKHKFDDSGLEWSLDAEQLALQYYLYLSIMDHFRTVLPGRVIDVRYEQLIHDPSTVMRDIVNKIGDIGWDENILKFHNSKRIVHTHSQSRKFS